MPTITLLDLFRPALRRAGITMLPGILPSTDQTSELIPEINRMMGSWNLDGHRIFNTSIDRYALKTPGFNLQSSYFIGPDLGPPDFTAPRPLWISAANIVITGISPELHEPLRIITDDEWASIPMPELSMAWPTAIYNDGGTPDSKLYLFGIPTEANDLELFTWTGLKKDFTAITDAVVLPDGYEAAIVDNLTLKVAALYPHDTNLKGAALDEARIAARDSLQAIIVMNSKCPPLYSEAAHIGGSGQSGLVSAAWWRAAPWYRR